MADCTICHEPLLCPGSSVTQCGHIFHTQCLELWLAVKANCPLCKKSRTSANFERRLLAPKPPNPNDDSIVRRYVRSEESSSAVEMLRARLTRCSREHDELIKERWQAAKDAKRRRAEVERMQGECLKAKRQYNQVVQTENMQRAQREQLTQTDLEMVDALAGTLRLELNQQASSAEISVQKLMEITTSSNSTRETISKHFQQLLWRCEELQELDGKMNALRKELSTPDLKESSQNNAGDENLRAGV